jgi:hypothetical protein
VDLFFQFSVRLSKLKTKKMSAFLRNLFSRSPPVGTVDNGGKVPASPSHSENERTKTKRLVKSAPSVLQKPSKKIPQLDARTLVNDFNQQQQQQQQVLVPLIRTRNTLADTQVDVIEYYCHLCLMETDPVQLIVLQQELSAAMVEHKHSSRMSNYGRLYNRLHIVALWNDMGSMRIGERGRPPALAAAPARREDPNIHSAQGSNTASSVSDGVKDVTDISAAQWTQITEQLVLVRGHLLRLDANLAVPTLPQIPATTTSRNDENKHPDNAGTQIASNEQVANYHMFQQDFFDVVLLLQVQQALACLRESLDSTNIDGTYYLISESSLQRAADACHAKLVRIFENQENQSADGQGLPESLSFLLHRKYQRRSGPDNHDTHGDDESVANLLRQDITAICLDETHECSHARLKEKVS